MNRHRHVSVITFVLVFVAGSLACEGPNWSAGEPSSATGEWARLTTTAREADESKLLLSRLIGRRFASPNGSSGTMAAPRR